MLARAKRRGAVVVGTWAMMNLVIVSIQFAFPSRADDQSRAVGWAMVAIIATVTAVIMFAPRRPRTHTGPPLGAGRLRNGATAPAFAAACLAGGLAWVFGIWMAYLALPAVVFCVARWRAEWALRRKERQEA